MGYNNRTNNKRIARNSIIMSIRMVIVLIISLFTTRIVLSMLGVEDYGIYNIVCGFVAMFAFLNTSMSNGIQRFFNFELGKNGEDGANKVFCMALLIQFIMATILIISTEIIGVWYLHNKMIIPEHRMFAAEIVFQLSILSFVIIIFQAPFVAAIMAHEKLDFYATVSILDAVLKLLLLFIIPIMGQDSLIGYGWILVLINFLAFTLYFIYSKWKFPEIQMNRKFHKDIFLSMLGFSGWNIFGSFSGIMKEQGINLVLNLFFGPVVNAARGIATQVNAGLQGFVSNLTVPVRPQVIQSYAQGNINRTLNLTYSISKLSCGFLYLMVLPISYEIEYILRLWLGSNVPEHTCTFIVIILTTSFFNNLNSAISGVIHAIGKMKWYQLSTSIVALLAIPLAYMALKFNFSAESALLMVTITMFFVQVVSLFILKNYCIEFSIREYCKKVVTPLVLTIIATIWIPYIPYSTLQPGLTRLSAVIIASVLSVIFCLYVFGLNDSERGVIKSFLKSTNK